MSRPWALLVALVVACNQGGPAGAANATAGAAVRIAVLVSSSSRAEIPAGPVVQGATVAIADLNGRHIAGLDYELVRLDDDSDAGVAASVCRGAVQRGGRLAAIVGAVAGPEQAACRKAVPSEPYVKVGDASGIECSDGLFLVGPTPDQRVRALVAFMTATRSARDFFVIAGSQSALTMAAAAVVAAGAKVVKSAVVGTAGTTVASLPAEIAAARPGAVIDLLAPAEAADLHRARAGNQSVRNLTWGSVFAAGISVPYASSDSQGVLVASDYLSQDSSVANRDWLKALIGRFGDGAAPAPVGAQVYDGLELVASALARAGTGPEGLTRAIAGTTFSGARGAVALKPDLHGHATLDMRVGLVQAGGVIQELQAGPALDPAVTCSASP